MKYLLPALCVLEKDAMSSQTPASRISASNSTWRSDLFVFLSAKRQEKLLRPYGIISKDLIPSSLSFSGAMNAGGCIWPRQNRSIRDPQNPKFGMELKDLFQSHCLQRHFLPSARLNLIPVRNWVRDL